MPALSDSVSIWWEPVTVAQFGFFGFACKKSIVGDVSTDQGKKVAFVLGNISGLCLLAGVDEMNNHLFLKKYISLNKMWAI